MYVMCVCVCACVCVCVCVYECFVHGFIKPLHHQKGVTQS